MYESMRSHGMSTRTSHPQSVSEFVFHNIIKLSRKCRRGLHGSALHLSSVVLNSPCLRGFLQSQTEIAFVYTSILELCGTTGPISSRLNHTVITAQHVRAMIVSYFVKGQHFKNKKRVLIRQNG